MAVRAQGGPWRRPSRRRRDGRRSPAEPARRSFRACRAVSETPPSRRSACRFLALETADGVAGSAAPDRRSREPLRRHGRAGAAVQPQQELVCLTAAHVNCPRYLRGVAVEGEPAPQPATREPMSPAVIGSRPCPGRGARGVVGFLAVRGGFDLPAATPSPGHRRGRARAHRRARRAPDSTPIAAVTASPTSSQPSAPSPADGHARPTPDRRPRRLRPGRRLRRRRATATRS